MACIPKSMIFGHVFFGFSQTGTLIENACEWWHTPVVVPARRAVWCIWRLGTWWKRIPYADIREIAALYWQSGQLLRLALRNGTSIDMGRSYSPRELDAIRDEILRRLSSSPDTPPWTRLPSTPSAEIWRPAPR